MQKHLLSKSSFLKSIQCQKALYLTVNHHKLKDSISEEQQALFNRGNEVGTLAHQLFPGGIDCSPEQRYLFQKAVKKTQNLIGSGISTLYEAVFQHERTLVMLDILHQENGKWYAYEVKSSAKVTKRHILDAALQYHIVTNAGLPLEDVYIITINKEYTKNGPIDLNQFFSITSVLKEVKAKQGYIKENLMNAKYTLQQSRIPKINIGPHCTAPYPCDFIGYCWQNVPENSILNLTGLDKNLKFERYHQGYEKIDDLPQDFELPLAARIQIQAHQRNQEYINHERLRKFMGNIKYPLYFMDFESFMAALPIYDGTYPYEHIPFQYSLHYQADENREVQHYEFLAKAGPDPRKDFLERLLADTERPGQLIVFDKNFEKKILNQLKAEFPAYQEYIDDRLQRIIDLSVPFHKLIYYHPAMKGSFKLKAILHAITGNNTYNEYKIEHGGIASLVFEQLIEEPDPEKVAQTRENLLAYCKMDTEALIIILEALKKKCYSPEAQQSE